MTVNARTITDEEFFYGHKACPAAEAPWPCARRSRCSAPMRWRRCRRLHERHRLQLPPVGLRQQRDDHALCGHGGGALGHRGGPARPGGGAPRTSPWWVSPATAARRTSACQALSGAIDRNDDVLYICYDNEAYMNTGIQKSSLTPFGASTTTTPAGKHEHGCLTQKKSLFDIVAAHRIPYAATASVGYLNDFIKKVERARDIKGTRFIHVMAPCPVGWGFPSADMVDVAKEIVDTGLWYLAEYEGPALTGTPGGSFRLNRDPKQFKPIEPYLRRQGRFSADDGARSGPHRARPRRALVLHARDVGVGKGRCCESRRFRALRARVRLRGLPREKMRYNGLRPDNPANVKRPWLNG